MPVQGHDDPRVRGDGLVTGPWIHIADQKFGITRDLCGYIVKGRPPAYRERLMERTGAGIQCSPISHLHSTDSDVPGGGTTYCLPDPLLTGTGLSFPQVPEVSIAFSGTLTPGQKPG